jgi:RNase P/RNase MRP subunit POP5
MVKGERQRYILVDYLTSGSLDDKAFLNAFWQTFIRLFGEVNASAVGMYVIAHYIEDRRLVVRCAHTQKDNVITAITLIRKVGGAQVAFATRMASGTLLSLRRKVKRAENNIS